MSATQLSPGGSLRAELSPTQERAVRPADLDVTTRQALEEIRAGHPQRTVEYIHRGDPQGHFNAERRAQVVANLLENALKYGAPDAPVRVLCEAGLIPQLFQPFMYGPQSTDTVRVSMGLGLYIVRPRSGGAPTRRC